MQLTVRDVSALFNVSEKTVYRWIGQGEIPAYRLNNQYRFSRPELLEWATARRIKVSPALVEQPEAKTVTLPTLAEAVEAGGIFYRVEGTDKPSVLRQVVKLLRLPEDMDREALLQVMMAREELASTGLGDGIAIPHVRNPIVTHVGKATVTLCFLEQAIDFAAIDGQPVRVLFTLVTPTVQTHLHLLSRLAYTLRNPEFRDVVAREGSREEILSAVRQAEAGITMPPPATER
jgi:PTS system nitrogen regulatory IIA component